MELILREECGLILCVYHKSDMCLELTMLSCTTFPVSIYRHILFPLLRQKRYTILITCRRKQKRWGASVMTAKKCTMVLDDRTATPIFQSPWKIYKSFSFEVSYLTQNSLKTRFEEEAIIIFLNNTEVSLEGNKTLWFLLWSRETYFIQENIYKSV